MTQIGFPYSEAHEALDQFLGQTEGGNRVARWIGTEGADGDGYGDTIAHIVPAETWGRVTNGYDQWLESQEVREEAAGEPAGYKPWQHSPLATTDRLLPTEPLEGPLARAIFRKPLSELPEDDRWQVRAHAINCLLRVQLDPDGNGAVPVLMVGHDHDEPGNALRWRIACVTGVPGLFVRVTANGFLGEEWCIVTGSGYSLASGWYSREEASRAVDALGRVLPNVDWMRLTPEGFTPRATAAIREVIQRYRFRADEEVADPEVMADAIPEAAEGMKSDA